MRGGLIVVPSAPVLLELERDPASRAALVNADLVITDSGLMVLMWRVLRGERLIRVSGLEYVRLLLETPAMRAPGACFWVMPTTGARDRTMAWLRTQGIASSIDDFYVAPMYPSGELSDPSLLEAIRARRPQQVVMALGGGTQERLGFFLKRNLDHRPGIHCIGAAIGFLTGDQVNIPMWADRLFLGWLFRCLSDPQRFVPRYWHAKRLVGLMCRYRDQLPELAR
jgi:UDP-N-acetyl-D-mannosaminuronic acid transferase (WecB/TagA/CpsF family)